MASKYGSTALVRFTPVSYEVPSFGWQSGYFGGMVFALGFPKTAVGVFSNAQLAAWFCQAANAYNELPSGSQIPAAQPTLPSGSRLQPFETRYQNDPQFAEEFEREFQQVCDELGVQDTPTSSPAH